MGKIDKQSQEALRWLRYILNHEAEMPPVTDWRALIAFAEKQALTGVCFPMQHPVNLDQKLVLQWIGLVQLIEGRNKLLNERISQLFGMLEESGFKCCLLKGQGNAALYPNPLVRCPGDIDLWVDADEITAYNYVKKLFPTAKESYKHIHFPLFSDASIDVHVTPLKFYSRHYNNRLQGWIEENRKEQFTNYIRLAGTCKYVSVPTATFNAVYQMGHMLIHFYDEGIGLRQIVDYYYVLSRLDASESERNDIVKAWTDLGMLKFAKAILWVESKVLGLPEEKCLATPNKKLGMQLLYDIVEGGNFGHYSNRYKGNNGYYHRGIVETWRNVLLMPLAPHEGMAKIGSKVGTAIGHATRKIRK